MVPGRRTPQGGRATERAKTPPDARARVRCSWSTSTEASVSRIKMSDLRIDTLVWAHKNGIMAQGVTIAFEPLRGRGARFVEKLTRIGTAIRTAAMLYLKAGRSGTGVPEADARNRSCDGQDH